MGTTSCHTMAEFGASAAAILSIEFLPSTPQLGSVLQLLDPKIEAEEDTDPLLPTGGVVAINRLSRPRRLFGYKSWP